MSNKSIKPNLRFTHSIHLLSLCWLVCILFLPACRKNSDGPAQEESVPPNPFANVPDVWDAARLKGKSAPYSELRDGKYVEIGKLTNKKDKYVVFSSNDDRVLIHHGLISGWVKKSHLISIRHLQSPGIDEMGQPDHPWIGKQVTVIAEEAPAQIGSAVIQDVEAGTNLNVLRVKGDWVLVDINGGAWMRKVALAPYDEAIDLVDAQIKKKPSSSLYQTRAYIYAGRDRFDKAIDDLSKAIELNPTWSSLYYTRAYYYFELDLMDEAIEGFSECIDVNPRDVDAYYARGYCYDMLGDTDLALEDYSEVIRLNRSSENAYDARAIIYKNTGQYELAAADYKQICELNQNTPAAQRELADNYIDLGFYDRALELLKPQIDTEPDNVDLLQLYGEVNLKLNRNHQAKRHLESALALDPDHAATHNALAWLYATSSNKHLLDSDLAIEHAIKANQLSDGNTAKYIATLAAAYARDEQYDTAIEKLDEAIEMNPGLLINIRDKMYAAFENRKPYNDTRE